MNIAFRTDSSLRIGSGHVMRCLTLADELRQRGGEICFICREHPGNLIDLIERKGYPVARLPNPECEFMPSPDDVAHAPWMGVSWNLDADETMAVLEEKKPSWLIIDHYAIDRRWEEVLRPHVAKLMVIDDLADRPHGCDLLLDQNLYHDMETRYNGLVPETCKKLLGPRYALLRPEFVVARANLRRRDGVIRRVFVFVGGVDQTNETEKSLQAMSCINDRQFEVDVVVGGTNLHKDQIQSFCATHSGFHYYCQVNNMAELMAKADIAIGAGGSATLERCCLGLPSLVMKLAENQRQVVNNLVDYGAAIQFSFSSSDDNKELVVLLSELAKRPKDLTRMSTTSLDICDGKGCERVGSLLWDEGQI